MVVLVNARSWQLECARVLHESLLVSVLMYGCPEYVDTAVVQGDEGR